MMKLVDFEHISRLGITPAECVSWADHIIRHKYECELPAKISIHLPDNVFVNTMPSYIPDEKVYGVKVVNRYPHRVPSLESCIMLFDSVTGDELALMDGTWVTAMRTGAVAALAIRHLRKRNAKEYAFMGLGNTCRATLLCMQAMEPEREIHVRLLAHKGQENDFMERFRDFGNISFTIVNDTESLVRGAEVILSCVTAADGLVAPDSCYDEGVLVVPVHTRGFQNCDLFFDKVFADDTSHVRGFKYFDKFRSFDEFSNVLLGKNPGRESDSERILSYNIGISLHDMYFASRIFGKIGNDVPEFTLTPELPKFWV